MLNKIRQALWDAGGASWSPVDREPIEALRTIGMKSALQNVWGDTQVFGALGR